MGTAIALLYGISPRSVRSERGKGRKAQRLKDAMLSVMNVLCHVLARRNRMLLISLSNSCEDNGNMLLMLQCIQAQLDGTGNGKTGEQVVEQKQVDLCTCSWHSTFTRQYRSVQTEAHSLQPHLYNSLNSIHMVTLRPP